MTESGNRDLALDFVKGMLVIGMAAYHVGSLFILDTDLQSLILGKALGFVSGSWIFISGLIISSLYRQKFKSDPWKISRRLWLRSVKIIFVFASLNIIIVATELTPGQTANFDFDTIINIIIWGDGKLTSFEILLGIGYVLLMAPFFLWFPRMSILTISIILTIGLFMSYKGISFPANVWMIMCGMAGFVAGHIVSRSELKRFGLLEKDSVSALILSMACTIIYFTGVTRFGMNRGDILFYIFGIASILSFIYLSYRWVLENGLADRLVRLMGRYSLVAYIGQMAIIWILFYVMKAFQLPISYWINFGACLVLMLAGILLLDYLLNKITPLRKAYNFIFG